MNCPYNKNYCYDKKILHITDLTNGVCSELHMCEKCAMKFLKDQKKEISNEESINEQIKIFDAKMKKAIKVENYEVAGVLKIKIQELKNLI